MKLIKMECPYCGAVLEADSTAKMIRCSYCGSNVAVSDEIARSEHTVRIQDEAKLREAELNERKYQEELQRKKRYEEEVKADKYKHGIFSKLNILMILLCAVSAYYGFSSGRYLAGVIAVLQIILFVIARMIKTNVIRGLRIPAFLFSLLACILVVPWSLMAAKEVYQKLDWPKSGLAVMLPKPSSRYGEIITDSSERFYARIEKVTADEFRSYTEACSKAGFQEYDDYRGEYTAYHDNGYSLNIDYYDYSQEMNVDLEKEEELGELIWPAGELCEALPVPPSNKGKIVSSSEDELSMIIGDMDQDAMNAYIEQVMESPFNVNYRRDEDGYYAENESGDELFIQYEGNRRLQLEILRHSTDSETEPATEEKELPEEVSEPAEPEPLETAETEQTASGIRPEFQKMMDDYEAFYDEYIAFMQTYSQTDDTMGMMNDYLELMNKANEMEQSINAVDESTLTPEEDQLYLEVTMRVLQKLNQAALTVN